MPSINDFVEHRWADTREELRKLDPDFVRRVEEAVRLNAVGLAVPDPVGSLRGMLPTEWHRLLEDCYELVMQADVVQTARDCLVDDSHRGLSSVDVGRRLEYHIRSWCIHTNTLGARTQNVISKTTHLYISDCKIANKIVKRHRTSVYNQVIEEVKEIRNQVSHGTTRSWVQAVTSDNLWEQSVAAGVSPRIGLDSFFYPDGGKAAMSGKYDVFVDKTKTVLDRLARILHKLEEDIATTHNA